MKAIIEFNLPEDERKLNIASNAKHWHQLVHDIQVCIHQTKKEYQNKDKMNMGALNALATIKWFIRDKLNDMDITFQYDELEDTVFPDH